MSILSIDKLKFKQYNKIVGFRLIKQQFIKQLNLNEDVLKYIEDYLIFEERSRPRFWIVTMNSKYKSPITYKLGICNFYKFARTFQAWLRHILYYDDDIEIDPNTQVCHINGYYKYLHGKYLPMTKMTASIAGF